MVTEHQHEQQERLDTFRNDQSVREQQKASTLHQHAQSQASDISGGRFAPLGAPHVIGSTPAPKYPAASAAHQTEQLPEEPLGYSVNDLDPTGPSPPVGTGPAADPAPSSLAPLHDDEQRPSAGPLSSSDPAGVHFPSPPGASSDVNAGSPPNNVKE